MTQDEMNALMTERFRLEAEEVDPLSAALAELAATQERCAEKEYDAGLWHVRALQAEAELAALQAAQQWRPVTENPVLTAQYQVAQRRGPRLVADHMAYYAETGWAGTDVIYWRRVHPLPHAPEEA